MLLAVDVGNTDVTFGVFKEEELITRFRFTVKVPRTSDEYGELLCNILEQKGFSPDDIDEVIIASVVPQMMYSFTSGIIKYLHCHPTVVGAGTKTGIPFQYQTGVRCCSIPQLLFDSFFTEIFLIKYGDTVLKPIPGICIFSFLLFFSFCFQITLRFLTGNWL